MLIRPRRLAVVVATATLAVLAVVVAGGLLTDTGAVASAAEDSPEWVEKENHTVKPTSHVPGTKTGLKVWASIPRDERYGDGFEEVGFAANWAPAELSKGVENEEDTPCSFQDIRTGGIDRGANNSGTEIDESVVSNTKSFWIEKNDDGQLYIMIEAFSSEDIGGEPFHLNYTDEVVVVTEPCFTIPENSQGWYRIGSYLNGTTWEGDHVEGAGYSHYIYICDCEDREEAKEVLGDPPVEGYGHEGSRVKARDEELDNGPPDSWDLGSPRTTGQSEGPSTPTPTASTATPTSTEPARTPTPTAGPRRTATEAPSGPAANTDQTPTDAAEGADPAETAGAGAPDQQAANDRADVRHTPTVAVGPGFGPVLAIVGLLGATMLLYRRS